jgi:hypothetical protein
LDSPVKCVERKNAQLGIDVAIGAGLNEELNKLRDVQTQQRDFLRRECYARVKSDLFALRTRIRRVSNTSKR